MAHACLSPFRTSPDGTLIPNGDPEEMLAAVRERGHDLPRSHREANFGIDVVVPFGPGPPEMTVRCGRIRGRDVERWAEVRWACELDGLQAVETDKHWFPV